ncbi:poly-beta-1,6-N-acetyl-D-glucosamine N-deacetylase PgaB [Candidimonas nitroreducens]|uniref:Poly-beta-1,6-N-acetyl-D-glucosamine N-deacetylase n=1 Tax=Candidimonas nitroreducens TaxID=683354 RepID=A0A225MWL8_9BURK|nr:poly-beta-1,6-N-acetyl-D-glucosamine N-deacetylase PgaB [Candidimonas nitroreducens]OWT65658.1 poly-beta-1,6-N-acetyl-D-glucosamine N-deacetylase [Candidimonas nitroreducens]
MSLFTLRRALNLIPAVLCCCLALLAGCARDIPAFVPPAERPVSRTDQAWPHNRILALAYHDVEDSDPDQRYLAVRTDLLAAQLKWLRDNGYQAVSVDQILAAHRGGKPLPPKAVLLSFDDGYSSFYTRVLPILKAMNWPAIWAPVGRWIDTPADQPVMFGNVATPRQRFATWDDVRRAARSGLVEIASHTDDLHFGIPANPQGNQEPAATSHRYDARTHSYETDAQYRRRIDNDVQRITRKIRQVTGKAPRVWVWPYGAANGIALQIIRRHGYQMALTLDGGLGDTDRLMSMPRMLVADSPNMAEFARSVLATESQGNFRVAQVDLDYVYDPDPAQMDENLGALVQRIADMQISAVFLQAYADPKGDGLAREVYFPNHWLPMRADLFNRTVWQLQTRAHVQVYAWMPVLSFNLPSGIARVQRWSPEHPDASPAPDPTQYARLSPFDPKARAAIIGLYEDMARNAPIDGILFHDDAVLSDFEDASPAALAAYRQAGLPGSIRALRADPAARQRWIRYKSQALIDFTRTLARHVKDIRGPQVKTARNIYAEPILNPASEAWYAQNLDDFLQAYDWAVPMAMPLMERVPPAQSGAWLDRLVAAVKRHPGGLEHTVFELQARNWNLPGQPFVDSHTLAGWMQRLQREGVQHFGYYPDDFVRRQPALQLIRPAISNAWYPYQ